MTETVSDFSPGQPIGPFLADGALILKEDSDV
ncbi:hypothetical protein FHS85_002891 [Rhodoligotrophos appendicifer]